MVAPPTPYRCFSCSLRAQKPEQDPRTTHFGFTNVPESQKESMGMRYLLHWEMGIGEQWLTGDDLEQWERCLAPWPARTIR